MTTKTTITRNPRRMAAVHGLAVVGFITLILLGIMLAIYSARFVPAAVSRVGSAAVYLSQVFEPAKKTDLTVVPQTVSFAATTTASTTLANATSTTVTSPLLGNTGTPVATNAGPKTTTTINAGGASTAPLYGQPDLAVTITQTGFLTGNSTDDFVAGTSVPRGDNAAVKFSVTNVGTNISGTWTFKATLPTSNTFTYNSNPQQSLRPGEHIEYTLGFNQAQTGNRTLTVTVDPNNLVSESSEANNSAASSITIQ